MAQIDPRMVKARSGLILKHPFWGALSLHLEVIEDASVETMATDGKRLLYAPLFLNEINEKELEGVLAHEVSHCAYGHHVRRGNRDPEMWNEAADYAINRDLLRAGFTLPQGILNDPRFDRMGAEEIYAVLKQEQEKQQQQQQGNQGNPQPGQGQPQSSAGTGQGNGQPSSQPQGQSPSQGESGGFKGNIGKCGKVLDAPKGTDGDMAAAEAEWKVNVQQAMSVEGARQTGNIPGHFKTMFDTIKKPLLDWREMLRRFINDQERVEYMWSRPNRRMLGMGYIIPGIIPDGVNEIGIIADSSASCCSYWPKFIAEIQAALDDGTTRKVTIISCDTEVSGIKEYQAGDKIDYRPSGGGGTRFSPALEWFAKNRPDVAALIYFTDLECDDFGEEPWVPLMWVACGAANHVRELAKKVPFGEVVHLRD